MARQAVDRLHLPLFDFNQCAASTGFLKLVPDRFPTPDTANAHAF